MSGGQGRPLKPWERAGTGTSGSSPFAPDSGTTSTAAAVAAAGTANSNVKPEEIANASRAGQPVPGRPMPPRPWERPSVGYGSTGYGASGYGTTGYGSTGYGSTGYGSTGYGGMTGYNRPMAGNYGSYGGYGGNYGSGYMGSSYGGGMYGGGMYNRYGGYGGSMNGGMMGGPYGGGPWDPNDPNGPGGPPAGPPSFWQSMLRALHGVVNFFGRISMLVDENTQAFHFFITALLQLADRAGMLYGELARFVLRILGFRTRRRAQSKEGNKALQGADKRFALDDKPNGGDGGWDNVWKAGDQNPAQ